MEHTSGRMFKRTGNEITWVQRRKKYISAFFFYNVGE